MRDALEKLRNAAAVPVLLRLLLGAVFIWAGLPKALGPQRFALDIESYQLLPPMAALAAAYYLPYLEIACGLCLLARRSVPGATLIIGGLMAVFTLALISAWVRGLEIRCGCFGGDAGQKADYFWWLLRDLALLAACAVLWEQTVRTAKHPSHVALATHNNI